MKNFFIVIILSIILSGCSALNNNPYYPQNAYQFNLNQPITVSAGSSYAYVLEGQVVKRDEINTFDVYCKLSVPRAKDSSELIIEPDVFKIKNTYQRYYSHNFEVPRDGLQVASTQLASFAGGGNGGSSRRDLTLFFELASETQAYVKSISCIRFADPRPYNLLKLEEAQNVFKDLGEFSTR